jgi:pyrroloquinoline quinone biosynthesis protein B
MRVRLLGTAAGGGFPQWNCGCANCRGVRAGTLAARARTQDSVAVGDGGDWFLLNCSPEVRQQLESFAPLQPRAPRDSPIRGILLTNGDLDHCLGLFSLREAQPLVVYTTPAVRAGLERNAMLQTLQRSRDQLMWKTLILDEEQPLAGELLVTPFALPGNVPLHLKATVAPSLEDNIGLRIRHGERRLIYAPGAATIDALPRDADCLLLDGTFWSDDELIRLGLGERRASDMAHFPVRESIAQLKAMNTRQKLFTHINNTNPILVEDSPERRAVEAAGWRVGEDHLELTI